MVSEFQLGAGGTERIDTDLLIIGVKSAAIDLAPLRRLDAIFKGEIAKEIAHRRFEGAAGTSTVLPTYGAIGARNLILFGLGRDPGTQQFRLLGEAGVVNARNLRAQKIAITAQALEEVEAIAEGAALSAYHFKRYKAASAGDESAPRIEIILPRETPEASRAMEDGRRMAAATNLARDLINTPADDATPEFLADSATTIARENGLNCTIHDRRGIEALKMGALLGVAKASPREPRFIELRYRPAHASTGHIALVGKGITFDSGGLNLKGAAAMEEQKRDMTGAAIMLGLMSQIGHFQPRFEVRAYLPCTENMIGASAIKPGDVLRSRLGKTIEVLNTDAEGRLVLADALAYACEFKPWCVIDAGTLTAAARAALGTRVGAVLGNDSPLVGRIRSAGDRAGETFWELPLVREYAEELKSNVADLRNVGTSGNAGTIICALFLKEFVSCPSWAHLDLSGVSFTNRPLPLTPPGAVGFGVRTLLRYLIEAA